MYNSFALLVFISFGFDFWDSQLELKYFIFIKTLIIIIKLTLTVHHVYVLHNIYKGNIE